MIKEMMTALMMGMNSADRPAVNLFKVPDGYMYELEVPGYSKENIEVTLSGDRIKVKGRPAPTSTEEGTEKAAIHQEFPEARTGFEVSLGLPGQEKPGRVRARVKDGILTILVKIREAVKVTVE